MFPGEIKAKILLNFIPVYTKNSHQWPVLAKLYSYQYNDMSLLCHPPLHMNMIEVIC